MEFTLALEFTFSSQQILLLLVMKVAAQSRSLALVSAQVALLESLAAMQLLLFEALKAMQVLLWAVEVAQIQPLQLITAHSSLQIWAVML